MGLELLADFDAAPAEGETESGELAVTDDVLVKAFAIGPQGTLKPHEHDTSTNVFHVLEGTITVERDGEKEEVSAPGVVLNERGQTHGAMNESDETVILTASLCPLPS